MPSDRLVLGIDGGGTKTVAWLAHCPPCEAPRVVGRGAAGPANPQAVGFPTAFAHLDEAVAAAFAEAGREPAAVEAAVLALAGSDRDENRRALARWAEDARLARRFRVVTDALPVLVAGSPEGWGIALISGTGSFAFGRCPAGRIAKAGGWGFLFGDEGSAYALALSGLRAAAKSADRRGPATRLLDGFLRRLDISRPEQLVASVYPMAADRAAIASLADVVTQTAAEGDPIARAIVDEAAGELAAMVVVVSKQLRFPGGAFPLVLAGGVLRASRLVRESLEVSLPSLGAHPTRIVTVSEPVLGAVRLARSDAEDLPGSPRNPG